MPIDLVIEERDATPTPSKSNSNDGISSDGEGESNGGFLENSTSDGHHVNAATAALPHHLASPNNGPSSGLLSPSAGLLGVSSSGSNIINGQRMGHHPGQVATDRDRQNEQVKLEDFSIAKINSENALMGSVSSGTNLHGGGA